MGASLFSLRRAVVEGTPRRAVVPLASRASAWEPGVSSGDAGVTGEGFLSFVLTVGFILRSESCVNEVIDGRFSQSAALLSFDEETCVNVIQATLLGSSAPFSLPVS